MTTRHFGTKVTLFTGVFLEAGSLIAASFVKQIWQLFLSQGVCFGLGMGFLFVGSVGIVSKPLRFWHASGYVVLYTRCSMCRGLTFSPSQTLQDIY